MSFVTGLMVFDAPASALNNAGADAGSQTDNKIAVKKFRYLMVISEMKLHFLKLYWIITLLAS
ncbi:MAG: hypothetical protein ACOY4I_15410 [Bacillota bacterium]